MQFTMWFLGVLLIMNIFSYCRSVEFMPTDCSPADRDALLGFKAGILTDTTGVMETWVGSDCCGGGWEGVECGGAGGGRVNKLILQRPARGADDVLSGGPTGAAAGFMKGLLSPSLGSLHFLETLVISGMKQLAGPIPESFSNLTKLENLVLDSNSLQGEIPLSLRRLKNLHTLSVSGNNLTGQIPDFLGSFRHLQHLNLAKNSLTSAIPQALNSLTGLQYLDLSSNFFSGSIPDFIGKFENLRNLDLSSNWLSGLIPDALCNLSQLSELSLDRNRLTGVIPKRIGNLKSLTLLKLSSNNLTGQIPESITQLHKLWSLNLSRNQFTNSLPETGLPSILSIDLSYSGLDLQSIPNWISSRKLYDLHLAGCNLRGALPNLAQPDSLRFLDLSDNYFTTGISSFLHLMKSLQVVKIANNLLQSDVSSIRLPNQVSVIDLHSNQLFGSLSGVLTSESNRFLEVLDLSQNQISGNFPELNTGLNLRVLNLGSNKIMGQIPESILNLDKLQRFDISRNKITGTIPPTLGNIVGLQWLDVSVNGIAGKIPESLLGIKALRYANFSANKLCGEIPKNRPFNTFPATSYAYNLCLCGKPLPPCKEK